MTVKIGPTLGLLFLSLVVLPAAFSQQETSSSVRAPELVVQTGHVNVPGGVAVSPDGKLLVTGSTDNTVRLWEIASGRQLRSIPVGPTEQIYDVAFSRDGRTVFSTGVGCAVKSWEVASGRLEWTAKLKCDYASKLALSPDGARLAVAGSAWGGSNGLVGMVSAQTGALQRTLTEPGSVDWVAFSPDGKWVASAGFQVGVDKSGLVHVAEADRGTPVAEFAVDGQIKGLAFSPDGKRLVASATKTFDRSGTPLAQPQSALYAWQVAGGRVLWSSPPLARYLGNLAFGADPDTFLLGAGDRSGDQLESWKIGAAGPARVVKIPTGLDRLVVDTRHGWLVYTGNQIVVADLAGARTFHALGLHLDLISAFQVSSDGKRIYVGQRDGTLRIFDLAGGQAHTQRLGEGWVSGLALDEPAGLISADTALFSSPEQAKAGSHLRLLRAQDGVLVRSLDVPLSATEQAAFSPDGKLLAVSGSVKDPSSHEPQPTVALFDVATGKLERSLVTRYKLKALPPGADPFLPTDLEDSSTATIAFTADGAEVLAQAPTSGNIWDWKVNDGSLAREPITPEKMFPGLSPNTFAVSPDGRQLAITDVFDIVLHDRPTMKAAPPLKGHEFYIGALSYSPDGKLLASGASDDRVIVWDPATGARLHTLAGHDNQVVAAKFAAGGKLLFSASYDGTVRVWDPREGRLLATILFPGTNTNDWLAVTPEGLFDGTPASWNQILWRFGGSTFDVAPVEVFFREYYYPGLLADILAGKRPKAKTDIAAIDRRQAGVKLALAAPPAEGAAIAERRVKVNVEVQEAPADGQHAAGSGAQDVRLFRNGSLVHIWHGDVLQGKQQATLEAEVTIVAGENKLTAYAFSDDNVKSSDATLTLTGADSLKRPGTAYILAVGINQYADEDFNLRYAAADAEDFSSEIAAQQQKLGRYAKVEVTALENEQATKANLLAALKHLAEVAQPEDAVFIYYAGHGTAAGPRFYLIPHDLGYAGTRDQLDEAAVKQVLAHSVSDLDLDQAFESIDAGEIVLVIDACRSGQALQADDPRQGPMNSKGLAQLAYEKGMYILTASQGYQAALEASSYGHGLLTYALVEEGLKSAKADDQPKDGEITLREWLDYAGEEVPQLELEMMQAAQKRGMDVAIVEGEQKIEAVEKRSLQRPRVFYRREPEATPFVVAKP